MKISELGDSRSSNILISFGHNVLTPPHIMTSEGKKPVDSTSGTSLEGNVNEGGDTPTQVLLVAYYKDLTDHYKDLSDKLIKEVENNETKIKSLEDELAKRGNSEGKKPVDSTSGTSLEGNVNEGGDTPTQVLLKSWRAAANPSPPNGRTGEDLVAYYKDLTDQYKDLSDKLIKEVENNETKIKSNHRKLTKMEDELAKRGNN